MDRKLYDRFVFFKEMNGCVARHAEAGLALARAEQWAEDYVEHVWEDEDETVEDIFGSDHHLSPGCELLCCLAYLFDENGEREKNPSASLGGIEVHVDRDRDYRRLVEAELSLELYLVHGVPGVSGVACVDDAA